MKDEIITCPICKYDIKKYKMSQHEKSQNHQNNVKQIEDITTEKPEQTTSTQKTFASLYAIMHQ